MNPSQRNIIFAHVIQVLSDGTNNYVYGYARLAQVNDAETGYFLTDALGSVRQVTDATRAIPLVCSYSPYGEMTDASGLVYLRALPSAVFPCASG